MDKEIKRLLKLKRIPNFKLSTEEEQRIEAWKNAQRPVEIIKPKKKYTRRKKTTNEVKDEEKEMGIIKNIIEEEES